MYNIIALMGESGSGKDTVLKEMLIQHPELHKIISSTSRPKREKEVEGINYHYYTDDEFLDKIINREMIEFSIFNNWQYGTEINALDEDKINVGVFNPQAIRSLLTRDDCFIFVVWVRTSDKERLLRQLNREENPDVREIVRRASADYRDFEFIEFEHYDVLNESYNSLLTIPKAILSQFEASLAQGQN